MTAPLMPSHSAAAETSAAFEEVFDFYRASGFLYPGKLAALAPRLPAIEQTWRRLLPADPQVFRFIDRRTADGELANSISPASSTRDCRFARPIPARIVSLLHPVELAALRLDDPELTGLRAPYGAHGLQRSRRILVVSDRRGVIGACLVNHASPGINFSFLENATEHLRVAPELPERTRRSMWRALAGAALAEERDTRAEAVMTLDPGDRALGVEAGLLGPEPKQYAVLTVSRRERGFLRSIESFHDYYRALESPR